jgi:ubiquinone/menaquinone biosynthesis C-methylase UbiE
MFPLPVHPFNLQVEGKKSYAHWQYEKGEQTIKFYLDKMSIEQMFKDKTVLDVACGAAGKTLYYASQGVEKIYGLDIIADYEKQANMLAVEKGLQDVFKFVAGSADLLPFDNDFFDTIIINDGMEHVDQPLEMLYECDRVLKPGGKLFINFPPYYHPFGAHLSDAIGFPWVHLFFNEQTLIKVYKDLVKDLPDGEERINFRISKDARGKEFFSYINKMTISRFNTLLKKTDFKVLYYKEVSLRPLLKPLCGLPVLKETFVKMVVCILEKSS